jgi:anaerobic selenocysteine-containing dehydrogenase
MKETDCRVIQTSCSLGDTSNCVLRVHVENEKIIKITPGESPGAIKRKPCVKGLSAHHWASHPDRLQSPLKRVGKRGEDKWEPISWDQALDEVAARLMDIAEKYGPESIGWMPADFPLLRQGGYLRLLSLLKGTWIDPLANGDIAGPNADMATFGWPLGMYFPGLMLENPKLAINWGYNPDDTDPFSMRVIMEGRKKGCRIVTIDPLETNTAKRSDEHIPIRPGTDGALGLGMMHVIMEKGLEDRDYIIRKTVGPLLVREDNGLFLRITDLGQEVEGSVFMVWDKSCASAQKCDAQGLDPELTGEYSVEGIPCKPAYQLLVDAVKEYPPERVSKITDVPVETIRSLAVEYGTNKPAALHRGWGMSRTFHGDLASRTLNTLAAITGNLNTDRPSVFVLDKRGFQTPAGPFKRMPAMGLYDSILNENPYPIKAMGFSWRNFLDQSPNRQKVLNELVSKLDLIVVCDLFMTNTGRHADYVLPVSSFLECTDLMEGLPFRYPFLQLQQKAVEPLEGTKSDFQIASELGKRMGFSEYFNKDEEGFIRDLMGVDHPTMEGVTFERLQKEPVLAKHIVKPNQVLRTPTGKIEFYVERLLPFGQELPVYIEPPEIGRKEKEGQWPLTFLTPHPKYRHHTTFGNLPELLKFDPEPLLKIHPIDAEKRNIKDGDVVCVKNDRGLVKLKANVTKGIKQGVVSVTEGWTPDHYIEGHHNDLISDRINEAQNVYLGANAAYNDVAVQVGREEL